MDRRNTTWALLAFGAALHAVRAQPAAKVLRIGLLGSATPDLLRQYMRDLGYVEGQNLVMEWRDSAGQAQRFDAVAAEYVQLRVDVIVAANPAATLAARRATASIPIVMMNTPDPVQLGLVTSLARPGGNVTGTTTLSAELSVKQLALLKEAIPQAVRIAVLSNPDNPWHPLALKGLEPVARSLSVQLQSLAVRGPEQFDGAYATMAAKQADAMLMLADPLLFFHRSVLVDLAAKRRLPAMYGLRGYVDAGGLMSYWANQEDLNRRVASYVDRIFKGAKPGDLPIEQPSRFELVVNLKTAKALGLTLPQSFLGRADEVIQ